MSIGKPTPIEAWALKHKSKIGVALLANAPERMPERRKRGREKEVAAAAAAAAAAETRSMPPVPTSGKMSSRAARQRMMAQREEQLAAQKVRQLEQVYVVFRGG
jgi:cation-transporting ATPase 13A1